MRDDWELRAGQDRYLFGPRSRDVRVMTWAFAGDGFRTGDASMPHEDWTAFGRDYIEAGELSIDVVIDFTSLPLPAVDRAKLAWDARRKFAQAWRADSIRSTPGATAELVFGGMFMIEGRPRRISWDDTGQNVGLVRGTAHFVPAGTGMFDMRPDSGGWQRHTVGLSAPRFGGFSAPFRAPLSTSRESSRVSLFNVGGSEPVWPVITINGPLSVGAVLEVGGVWRMPLNRALGQFDTVRIDTRPGHRSMRVRGRAANVLHDDAVTLAGASIPPGRHELILRGKSLEGTATATIEWLNQLGG